ncbi:MAG: cupredoxin domain-containing protein [Thermomicrobiales bacterium]
MRDGHDSGSNDIDTDAAEQINDALDAIVRGTSPAFHRRQLDEPTAHVVDRIGRTAHADAPAPNPTFVTNLKETLMPGTDTALPLNAPAFPSRARRNRPRWQSGRAAHPARSRWDRISAWGMVEAAAILLVVVLAGTLLYGLKQPPPEPTHHLLAPQPSNSAIAAIDATPDATPNAASAVATTIDVPCDVAETSATPDISGEPSTETLLPWPTSGDRPAIQGWPALLPEEVPTDLGSATDHDTVTAIATAASELRACVEAGDVAGTKALLSNDYLGRLDMLMPSEGGRINPDSPRTLVPLAANGEGIPQIQVGDVHQLPDGRVIASLTPENVAASGVLQHFLYIFVEVDGTWLVDEAIPVAAYPSTEVSITDSGFTPSTIDIAPQTSKMMNFIVHNEGTVAHTFSIPSLNVLVTVAPGETQRLAVQLRSGVFALISTSPEDVQAGLTGTIRVGEGIAPENSPVIETPTHEAGMVLIVTGDAPADLLAQPDVASDVIATVPAGTRLVVLYSPDASNPQPMRVEQDGEQWYLVTTDDGTVGWITESSTRTATP